MYKFVPSYVMYEFHKWLMIRDLVIENYFLTKKKPRKQKQTRQLFLNVVNY